MTSRIQTIAILLLSVLCLAAASNLRPHLTENVEKSSITRNPDTVDELDIGAYLGLW